MIAKGSFGFLRFLAILSAVALGAGYVVWKNDEASPKSGAGSEEAGVAALVESADEEQVRSSSPGGEASVSQDGVILVEGADNQPLLFSGSKSTIFYPREPLKEGDDVIRVLPGSKSAVIRVLPGSKSINFILDNPKIQESKKKP